MHARDFNGNIAPFIRELLNTHLIGLIERSTRAQGAAPAAADQPRVTKVVTDVGRARRVRRLEAEATARHEAQRSRKKPTPQRKRPRGA